MEIFLQQVVSGLATGGIYASLALALVMIYQATDVVNFAQGEMAMFATYLTWSMLNAGVPYWWAFLATVIVAFGGGILIQRIVVRPVENAPILTIVIDMVITTSLCVGLSRLDAAEEHGAAQAAKKALKGVAVNPLPWSILLGGVSSALQWKPVRPLAFCRVIFARRSCPTCAHSTTRSTTCWMMRMSHGSPKKELSR